MTPPPFSKCGRAERAACSAAVLFKANVAARSSSVGYLIPTFCTVP